MCIAHGYMQLLWSVEQLHWTIMDYNPTTKMSRHVHLCIFPATVFLEMAKFVTSEVLHLDLST